ncbi:MAG: TIGR02281 family clan AA aspartic protease [Gammaproteobacteria bacterium]|nr:TIGR02281 family clan AA aspartic protease [Gammaproteobacteria bacterium]
MTENQHSTKKLGMMFTLVGWILGFLLLALFFTEVLDSRNNPNRSVATSSTANFQQVILQRNPHGHYVFDGEINHKRVTFLVDTGATTTAIPAQLGNYLDVQPGPAFKVRTANGVATAYATRLAQMKLGDIEFSDVEASLNPGMNGKEILLGMNILRNLELIQRSDQLIIRQYY